MASLGQRAVALGGERRRRRCAELEARHGAREPKPRPGPEWVVGACLCVHVFVCASVCVAITTTFVVVMARWCDGEDGGELKPSRGPWGVRGHGNVLGNGGISGGVSVVAKMVSVAKVAG